jgi:hypothetical protein
VPAGGDDILRTAFPSGPEPYPDVSEELTAFQEFSTAVAAERNLPQENCLSNPDVLAEVCHVLLNQKEFLFLN